MKIQIHTPTPPAELLAALERASLQYTNPVCLYHYLWLGMYQRSQSYCGVFGDGDNAAYEWFIWRNGQLETSNDAYGMTEVALRDVLNKVLE
jgi:hypothetical protein